MEVIDNNYKKCPFCGGVIYSDSLKCRHCGEWLTNKENKGYRQVPNTQQVIINKADNKNNGIGTAGFVISLVCLLLSWLPGVNCILWLTGLVFSIIGMTREPKNLAVAGFIISIAGIVLILLIFGGILALIMSII